ncbi:MAG TPA: radical SAM protein, partial [Alphaproteobacteria bacterium]|nr:radical SAM protein [Alphaproteobacteria bacterium]
MFGKNPKRKATKGVGNQLDIQEVFATIQGEGPNAGTPSVFLRLSGCNLACEFCDTEFENFKPQNLENIISEIKALSKNENGKKVRNLVVITGGEPLRQPIEKLCDELILNKFSVQIETNGTIFRNLHEKVEIICSPKNNGMGYKKIRPDLLERITAFKFIISANNKNYSSVPDVGQSEYKTPVYIQPMDEYNKKKNLANLEYCKKLA